jgi:DNA mismatch repair protein MutS
VAQELHDTVGARTLFATHFHELTALIDHLDAARNYSLAVTQRGREVLFMRRLVAGGADKSYGIAVARLAGLPEHVVERADAILARLENARSPSQPPAHSSNPRQADLLAETGTRPYAAPVSDTLVPPGLDKETLWTILQELANADIANLTPVQALVLLNELQTRLHQA